jgi:hypothetical protein
MEDTKLEEIWKAYSRSVADAKVLNMQSWAVNIKTFEYLQMHNAKSKLKSLGNFKKWAVLLGILWVLLLGTLVYGNDFRNMYFSISVMMIMIFTIIAIAVYIKHIVLINQINLSESIIEVQEKLAELQASTINIVRILWLQMPFYTTFFWSSQWITRDIKFWLISFPVTLLFIALTIWLYMNISYRNVDKRWFRILFGGIEWAPVIKAINYLKEIEDFKNG